MGAVVEGKKGKKLNSVPQTGLEPATSALLLLFSKKPGGRRAIHCATGASVIGASSTTYKPLIIFVPHCYPFAAHLSGGETASTLYNGTIEAVLKVFSNHARRIMLPVYY